MSLIPVTEADIKFCPFIPGGCRSKLCMAWKTTPEGTPVCAAFHASREWDC